VTEQNIKWWREKPVWIMLFLGFSAGIPILLIFSSLSLWLREAGVERSTVTFFSWAVLGYSFKFVWAPLVDRLPIPFLTASLGRRRSWMLLAQFSIMAAICLMAMTDPQQGLQAMAIAAVLLGFASATQDIVIDAYRIESAVPRLQAMLSSTYIAGYRIGMIVTGAGALSLAEWFGSTKDDYSYLAWQQTYLCAALVMLVGVITTLVVREPVHVADEHEYRNADYFRFFLVFLASIAALIAVLTLSPSAPEVFTGYAQTLFAFMFNAAEFALAIAAAYFVAKLCLRLHLVNAQMVETGYQAPIKDFLQRYGRLAIWVLLLVGFYRVSDIVLGVIANVFYQDMGYSKTEIGSITKIFGVLMTITGSFFGGLLALRYGVMRTLMTGAILVAVTNLLFVWLANSNPDLWRLAAVIVVDNMAQGIALAAFIAWLSSLTNVSFTATQYAIFSSLMTLFPKLLGGYSGTMVEAIGYSNFFLFASALGIPVIALIYFLSSRLEINDAATEIR
jgi:PAT family beta-lactamase induction signal transducer AmpG